MCIANYGNEPTLLPLFADSFKRMAASTFQLLRQAPIAEHPDIVDDYFELASKVRGRGRGRVRVRVRTTTSSSPPRSHPA